MYFEEILGIINNCGLMVKLSINDSR